MVFFLSTFPWPKPMAYEGKRTRRLGMVVLVGEWEKTTDPTVKGDG
jgi:hypothetical protein